MILVTGAAGQSGSRVIREFVKQKTPVKALIRDSTKAAPFMDMPGVEVVVGDMLRPETLGPALLDVDRILMISSSGVQMADTQCTFIDAAKKAGVEHIVKFSGAESGMGFDATAFRFTRMHEEIERYLEGSGLAWTHLRPSQFMQVYLREAPSIIKSGLLALALEDATLSPVDLVDVARVAYGLLTTSGHAGKRFSMTGPEALNMNQIAAAISEAISKPVRYLNLSPEDRKKVLEATGMPPYFVDAMDEQAAERRRCPVSRIDTSAQEMFGIKPVTFAEFARKNADFFRASPA